MKNQFVKGLDAFKASLIMSTALGLCGATTAHAQQNVVSELIKDDVEEITIEGELTRSLEDSIELKRTLSVVADGIVGAELGDLPDLSIAETLERIVGVTSDRFKGGASELSIRGLGAFLGASYFNGREITSGSDGRDVNFGQFPSELINGAIVYKTQQASFIEGGTSGIIELQTLRPLDYGKRRLLMQGLVGYSDAEDRVDGGAPFSGRATVSYVDQFEGGFGELGIAIGGQIRRDTAPEDIFTSSSTFRPCNSVGGSNCSFDEDDPESETYFVSNQYIYRAMQTDADRDAIMANIQWRPNNSWEINFDGQWSDRRDLEERANLVLADGRRGITPIEISPTGALLAHTGNTRIENQSVWRLRTDEYIGLGLNVAWQSDRLTVAADFGYNQTKRRQDELDMRIRTNRRVDYEFDTRGTLVPSWTFTDVSAVEDNTGLAFDLDNHDIYNNGARARRRLENVDDEIISFRLDASYSVDNDWLTTVDFGFRFADRHRQRDDGIDTTIGDLVDGGYGSDAVIATRRDRFVNSNLYADTDTTMQGITWATWDPEALFVALTGDRDAGLQDLPQPSTQDADVTETTYAGYAQANFETDMFGKVVTGNVGLRVIRTNIESVGISANLATMIDPEDPEQLIVVEVGDPVSNLETNGFWNFLPSANLNFELRDDLFLRLGVYRAMSRPDPEAMSAALAFDDNAPLLALGDIVRASGNPFLEPLESWNFDVSLEYYPSEDSAFSLAMYAKSLQAGFTNVTEDITLNVDGSDQVLTVGRVGNSDDGSRLLGFEISAQHVFSNLPGVLGGLGVQLAYGFADSNFEFPDPRVIGSTALADFTTPANIPGYSRHTGNIAVFWEQGPANVRLAYKVRSDYFKPFRQDANRFTDTQGFLDFSASYDITKWAEIRVQALNLLDEPNVFFRPTRDSLAQTDLSGRRFFIGARLRF